MLSCVSQTSRLIFAKTVLHLDKEGGHTISAKSFVTPKQCLCGNRLRFRDALFDVLLPGPSPALFFHRCPSAYWCFYNEDAKLKGTGIWKLARCQSRLVVNVGFPSFSILGPVPIFSSVVFLMVNTCLEFYIPAGKMFSCSGIQHRRLQEQECCCIVGHF